MSDLTPVESSNLKAIGYDPDLRRLTVQFNSGATHHYIGVDPHTHAALMAAPSKGQYFHRWIRNEHRSERADV